MTEARGALRACYGSYAQSASRPASSEASYSPLKSVADSIRRAPFRAGHPVGVPYPLRPFMYRSTSCNSLRQDQIGHSVTLAGWVNSRRDHGGVIFIDLRDREGLTQVVFRPEEHPQVSEASHGLRSEDVIQITGVVSARLAGTENANWRPATSKSSPAN